MGLVIISIVLTLVSPLMTLFPSKLPTKKGERTDADVSNDLRLIVSIRKGVIVLRNARHTVFNVFFTILRRLTENYKMICTL